MDEGEGEGKHLAVFPLLAYTPTLRAWFNQEPTVCSDILGRIDMVSPKISCAITFSLVCSRNTFKKIPHSEVDLHFLTEVDFTYAHC